MEGVDCGSAANTCDKYRAVRMRSRGVGDRRVRVYMGCCGLEFEWLENGGRVLAGVWCDSSR